MLFILTSPKPGLEYSLAIGRQESLDFFLNFGRNIPITGFSKKIFHLAVMIPFFREPPPKLVQREHGNFRRWRLSRICESSPLTAYFIGSVQIA